MYIRMTIWRLRFLLNVLPVVSLLITKHILFFRSVVRVCLSFSYCKHSCTNVAKIRIDNINIHYINRAWIAYNLHSVYKHVCTCNHRLAENINNRIVLIQKGLKPGKHNIRYVYSNCTDKFFLITCTFKLQHSLMYQKIQVGAKPGNNRAKRHPIHVLSS